MAEPTVRDSRIGAALATLPVPEHNERFFDRLHALLEHEEAVMQTTPKTDAEQEALPIELIPGRRSRIPRYALALAAALTILLVIGAAALVLNRDDQPDVTGTTAVTPTTQIENEGTTTPTSAPQSTSIAPPTVRSWSTAVPSGSPSWRDVVETRNGLFSVGYGGIWRSAEGLTWNQVLELTPPDENQVTHLAQTDEGFVAAGARGGPGGGSLYVWMSNDGEAWEPLALWTVPFPSEPTPLSLVTDGGRLLVTTDTTGLLQLENQGTQVFWSVDGVDWHYVPSSESGLAGVRLSDVVLTPGGYAGLGMGPGITDPITQVWTSPDGTEWDPVPGTESLGDRLIVAGGQLLLVSPNGVFTSNDGFSWEAGEPDPGFEQITDISAGDTGLIVSALRWPTPDAVGIPDSEVWISSDGMEWELVSEPGLFTGSYVWQVSPLETGIIGFGQVPDDSSDDPTDRVGQVWILR